jgi:peptide/nickel transport system substrate-binding protein
MKSTRRFVSATLIGVAAVTLAACGSSSSSSTTTQPATTTGDGITSSINNYDPNPSGTKSPGGTVYWAQAPAASPDYIFPMVDPQTCSVANTSDFSEMMYRPLYWFGNNNSATVDYNYSIAKAPVFSNNDQTVTITLNDWKWSDGEQVTSQDVALWIGMYKANVSNYCAYVPPAANGEKFFPDNVSSVETPSANTVVLNLTQSYNPNWFLYNELAQITPLPMAWDATSLAQVGKNDNATVNVNDAAGNEAVYNFLNAQSNSTTTWVGSPIWSIVDGPWTLSAATATGEVDLVPNTHYSGSPKPSISKFVELPFTDNNAELTALKTDGPSGLTVGYLPPEDASQNSSLQSSGYADQSAYTLSFNYFPINLNNPTIGTTFQQLYFRQAFQHLIDQEGWLTAFLHGWGEPTSGPVPAEPANTFADAQSKTNPYPYSISDAKSILTSHGWKVNPGGTSTCEKPGTSSSECGAGVAAGTQLAFNIDYASGTPATQSEMEQLQSSASQVGIKINLTSHAFATVIGSATSCTPSQPVCSWTAENWGAGWVYSPDYYPSGESLFATGAGANYGNYDNSTANNLILATTTASAADSQNALNAYQNYMIQQVPVIYEPTSFGNPIAGGPALVSSKLGGVTPNAYSAITPETWYFTK